MIQTGETVVRVIGAKNAAEIWLRREPVNRLDLVDGLDVCKHGRIVEGRLSAALSFIVPKDKGLVFRKRPANRRAKLILPQRVRAGRLEQIDSVEGVVAEVLVEGAMPFVGAAASDDIHDPGSGAAKFSGIVGIDHAKFLNGLLRWSATVDLRRGGDIAREHGSCEI